MKTKDLRPLIYVLFAFFVVNLFSIVEATTPFPTKAIIVVVHSAPGAAGDLALRMLAKGATELFGQPVVAENEAGGGGYIAMAKVYNTAPDGYTLINLASSKITPEPLLRKAPYDPWRFTPIMSYAMYPFTLTVRADRQWKTMKEFVEYIRKNPGKVSLSSGAPNSMQNIAMFMLQDKEKLDFKLVPFGDGAQNILAALGGHTDGSVGVGEAIPHIKEGRMRCLATMGNQRISMLPDVPTLKECGYDVAVESRICIYGPPGIPKDIVKKLEETFKGAMASDDFKKICQTLDLTPSFLNGDEIDKYHRNLEVKIKNILIKIGMIKE